MRQYYFFLIILFLIGGIFCSVNFVQAEANYIIINEIYGGGGNKDAVYKNDFIELYNPTNSPISLSGWSVQYASKTGTSWTKTELSNNIPAHGFYLIQEKAGSGGTVDLPTPDAIGTIALSATDGKVKLTDAAENIIDFVGYGSANEYEGATGPAPSPGNTKSVERKNNQDTDNNAEDFILQDNPNPQNSGSTPPPTETDKIIINEIAWMGTTSSSNDEWIELFNNSSSTAIIDNWTLKITEDIVNLTGSILPGDYLILNNIPNLNNNGETLELRDSENNPIDSVDASQKWLAGNNDTKQTMERKIDGSWQTSLNPGGTPGAPNSVGAEEPPPITPSGGGGGGSTATNHPPIAQAGSDQTILTGQEIIFDGSKSSDPDNDKLNFFWNFGNGEISEKEKISFSYNFPGTYLVTLTVSDGKLEATDALEIYVFVAGVVISEFNPSQNWVELYNSSEQIINLENYKLNNFVFPKGSLIGPKQYLVVELESLSNSLKLIYPNDQIAQEIKFEEIKENSSINRISDQEYFWSSILTPGAPDFIGRGLINQTPTKQISVQEKFAPQASKNPVWSALAKSLTMQDQKPIAKIAIVQTKKPLISDAMGKFLLALSIAISFGFLGSWLILKLKRLI